MNRRNFLQGAAFAAFGPSLSGYTFAAPVSTMQEIAALQNNWRMLLAADFPAPAPGDPLKIPETEWRKRLDGARFHILREEGTERAGTSPLNAEKRPGVFACAGCDLPLFTSAMKYDSRTGWPSFFTTIPGVFATKTDYKLLLPRTEYHCVRCGGHQGHVFEDGPEPTRQRWCNNGLALKFVPLKA